MSATSSPASSSLASPINNRIANDDNSKSDESIRQEKQVVNQYDIFGSDTESPSEDENIVNNSSEIRNQLSDSSTSNEKDQTKSKQSNAPITSRDKLPSSTEEDLGSPQPADKGTDESDLDNTSPIQSKNKDSSEASSPHQISPENVEETNLSDHQVEEPDETRIAVDFPLIRADLGRDMHLVKMPNFLSVETRPFDPAFYEDELDEDDALDEEGRTRLKLKVENTIRWRFAKNEDGDLIRESNSRIVRWSDGSLSLYLGDEIFDVHKMDIQSDFNHLFIREGSGLQGQAVFKTKLTFRPHSTDSFTHRKITLSLADKTNKSQKVKILPIAGADPESNRSLLVRKEEEKLRASLRRESQQRRMRERQLASAAHRNRRSSGSAGYADREDSADEDNSISLAALKRDAKAGRSTGRKTEVSALYSDDDSTSDVSETPIRKKAKINDDDESD